MKNASSRRGVAGSQVSTQCHLAGQDGDNQQPLGIPENDIAAKREEIRQRRAAELDGVIAQWFSAALDTWGKDENYADELGVSKNIVSDMQKNKRVVKLRDCLPLLDNPESAKVLLGALCEYAGFAAPGRKRVVTRAEVDAKTAQLVRRTVTLWKLIKREVAAELGADEEQVDLATEG
jgi:hypothetical protein